MLAAETKCLFVSDLHGRTSLYERLCGVVAAERPSAVFLGGDIFPHVLEPTFLETYLIPRFRELYAVLKHDYPTVYMILGNDDPLCHETRVIEAENEGLWKYLHNRKVSFAQRVLFGYACVPPTPFRLKDWERYDVSRYSDPGCISPEEGSRTVAVDESEIKWGTIKDDLHHLTNDDRLQNAVFLFHSPPYDTPLDRAALDGKTFEHTPLDLHVGSIAIRRFIESRQPLLTLHGHVHESARLTGLWKTSIGRTTCINAAHDGPELAVVRFDLSAPANATRELI